jgi:flagellar L-ring protein FlgH
MLSRRFRRLAPAATLLPLLLTACALDQLKEVAREPIMSPVGSGLAPDRTTHVNLPVTPVARAIKIGDVVTVKIQINDKASLDNTLNSSRNANVGLTSSADFDFSFGAANGPTGSGKLDGNLDRTTSTDSKGTIDRSETINLLVGAVVSQVLPNGNLVISGSQEVRVNYELRVLNVQGVIRPRDIATDNSISYEKIAEARISYGGRGPVMQIQKPAYGQQILDILAPF